jgi:glycosyltransferase involved in cell wall biosynthesis
MASSEPGSRSPQTERRDVDLRRLAASSRRKLLQITHEWGGGVEKHVADLAALLARDCEVLVLKPIRDVENAVVLQWANPGETFEAYFQAGDYPRLVQLLSAIGVERVHLHHIHDLPREILGLPRDLGVPYDCTLHDYYAVCPQYQLVTPAGQYCGEPDTHGCGACLLRRPARWGLDILAWRAWFGEYLAQADRVIAPSHDVQSRMRRYFPELRIRVWPHPEAPIVSPVGPKRQHLGTLKILLLGGISPAKGLRVLEACAIDAQVRELPLYFRVLGHTSVTIKRAPEVPLSIHGQYRDADLRELIELERANAIFFPAQVPETHSYTLSAAIQTGLPIFASNLGALPERLAPYPDTYLLPWDASAEQWNNLFLSLHGTAASRAAAPTTRGDQTQSAVST